MSTIHISLVLLLIWWWIMYTKCMVILKTFLLLLCDKTFLFFTFTFSLFSKFVIGFYFLVSCKLKKTNKQKLNIFLTCKQDTISYISKVCTPFLFYILCILYFISYYKLQSKLYLHDQHYKNKIISITTAVY